MGDKNFEYVQSMLELMAKHQFLPANMDPAERASIEVGLGSCAGQLIAQFEEDRKEAEKLAEGDARRKTIERNIENLAKALPNICKGTLSAITAFKKNDNLNGAAAVMDICASLAPLIAGLSAAGGPPGMLVGAIFSLVSQILSFFGPKSESLTSQIENILRKLGAEEKLQETKIVHKNVTTFAASLRRAGLTVENSVKQSELDVLICKNIVGMLNPLEGNTVDHLNRVIEWLDEPNNQSQELWPLILGSLAQAWCDMLIAMTTLAAAVHTDKLQQHYGEHASDDMQKSIQKLQAKALALVLVLNVQNRNVRDALQRLRVAAQDRGMLWLIDDSKQGRLYAGTNISKASLKYLGGEQKRITVAKKAGDLTLHDADFQLVGLEPWVDKGWSTWDRCYRGVCKSPYEEVQSTEISANDAWLHSLMDVWAIPNDQSDQLALLSAKATELKEHRVSADGTLSLLSSNNLKAKINFVRAVAEPQMLENDPVVIDNPDILRSTSRMTYCVLESGGEICIEAICGGQRTQAYIGSPLNAPKGISIDANFVWIFNADTVACTTHAAAMRYLKDNRQVPTWMQHRPEKILFTDEYHQHQAQVQSRPALQGLLDVSSGDDSTLVVSAAIRSVVSRSYDPRSAYSFYEFSDTTGVFSGVINVNLQTATLAVEWRRLGAMTAVKVQKTPIYCWNLVEDLTRMLDKTIPALDHVQGQ